MEFTQGGEMGHWSRAALPELSSWHPDWAAHNPFNSSLRESDVLSGLHRHLHTCAHTHKIYNKLRYFAKEMKENAHSYKALTPTQPFPPTPPLLLHT